MFNLFNKLPNTTTVPPRITIESEMDVVDLISRPIIAPNRKKFNAMMVALTSTDDVTVSYTPVIGSDVTFTSTFTPDESFCENITRVYKNKVRTQRIVGGALAAGTVLAIIMAMSGNSDDPKPVKDVDSCDIHHLDNVCPDITMD